MICLFLAAEADIPRVLEIERESIAPPWTHGALLAEVYREDSFFAVAAAATIAVPDAPAAYAGLHSTAQGSLSTDSCCSFHASAFDGSLPIVGERAGAAVLGFVILRRMGDEGELLQIAVDSAARRCGVGDLLMGAALRYARDNALRTVFLEVRKSNEAAIALYWKHGFNSVRLRKDYYSDPVEEAVVMASAIQP